MITHALIAIVLIIALIAVTNPFMVLMPHMAGMVVLIVIAALVAAYAGLILAEKPADEREEAHRSLAARAGFVVGIVVLTVALLAEGLLRHHIDPWVPLTLGAMIVAKVATRGWHHHHS